MNAKVLILMGSDSDWEVMSESRKALDEMGVEAEIHISSAHRTPARTGSLAREAAARGIQVIICGAGAAAHLALLSTAQMPGGVPVGTMAVGKAGARNAGLLAARILALSDPALAARVREQRARMAREVEAKDAALQLRLQADKKA
ncbi:MAG: 5-(carboxyamino)imidazole ribonucleotide mutase [Deltaproteobacteria bacterium]|nr:5-(carboxyamino)imidazole ribonucleotide mutase [Deltaproteobacteria bacterium]